MTGEITVLSREDGSGTRGAFIELFGIEQKNDAGEKEDMTTDDAQITNSTSVMMTTVQGNPKAIGYISLGSLDESVGMASRELKDSELEAGLTPTVIAQDGIAVIVNKENALTGLTSEQVLSIYTGETTDWSELQ